MPLAANQQRQDFYRDGQIIEERKTPPDAGGRFHRVRILHHNSFKYPYIRIEQDVLQPQGGNPEQVLHEEAMVADHLLVRLAPGESEVSLRQFIGPFQGSVQQLVPRVPLYIVKLPQAALAAFDNARQRLNQRVAPVAYAEPDYIVNAEDVTLPNDPSFSQLWGLHNTGQSGGLVDADIDAPEAWEIEKGSRSIIVGVIDTGVDYTHPDLTSNMWTNPGEVPANGLDDDGNGYVDDIHGYDFVNHDGDPKDDHYHGTHCAGTIGAVGDNGIGVVGVAQRVSIMAIKFLSSGGSGATSDAVSAVYYATANGVNLTSNSWGGGGYSQSLKDAIDDAGAHNQLFVAAAGNDSVNNDSYPHYPSSYTSENLIAVAATDSRDLLAYFSNFGSTSVDLAAPGVSIYSTSPGAGFRTLSGTSMATPHVSGACALLWSLNPAASAAQVKASVLESVDIVPGLAGDVATGGRLNVARMLSVADGPYVSLSGEAFDEEGDGNGVINPGESARLTVTLRNVGTEPATGITATLSSGDPGVSIFAASAQWAAIPSGEAVTNGDQPFRIAVDDGIATPHNVRLYVSITADGGKSWEYEVPLSVYRSSVVSGTVTDLATGQPISGALVEYLGSGGGTVTTDGAGTYAFEVVDGTYTLTAAAPNYVPADPVTVTAPPSHDGIDFALGQSSIQVDPVAVSSVQTEETVTQHVITIRNEGNVALNYTISSSSGPAASAFTRLNVGGPTPVAAPAVERTPDEYAAPPALTDFQPDIANLPFGDGFEDGNFSDWITDSASGLREVVSDVAHTGQYSFHFQWPGSVNHFHGIHQEFPSGSQPGYVSFYIRSGSTTTSDAYFVLCDTKSGLSDAIWFFAQGTGFLYVNADVGGHDSYPYHANQWYHIEFRDIDWDNKRFDYYVNGALVQADIPFRHAASVQSFSQLYLYNFSTNSEAWWDDIDISNHGLTWLNFTPTSGSVPPGGSVNVTVTLDSRDILPGQYEATLDIATNIPDTPPVAVPVHLDVTPLPNDPPEAQDLSVTTAEDTSLSMTLPGSDPEGKPLTARVETLPHSGMLYQTTDGFTPAAAITEPGPVTHPDRKLIYVPAANVSGDPAGSFTFRLFDGRLWSNTATATLRVTPVNDTPIARNDTAVGGPAATLPLIPVLDNDSDVEDTTLTIVSFTQGERGTVSNNGNGTLHYVPDSGFGEGTDSFTYTIADTGGGTATATVSVRLGVLAGGDWTQNYGNAAHNSYYPGVLGNHPLTLAWRAGPYNSIRKVVISQNTVYIPDIASTSKPKLIHAVDLITGTPRWTYTGSTDSYAKPPAYYNGLLYLVSLPSGTAVVTALDASTGTEKWETQLGSGSSLISRSPTVDASGLYIEHDLDLAALDSNTGVLRFRKNIDNYVRSWMTTVGDDELYTCVDGILRAHDPITSAQRWQFSLPPGWGYNTYYHFVAYSDGMAYVPTTSGLFAIDTATHQLAWSVNTPHRYIAAVNKDMVFAFPQSGNAIYSYHKSDGTPGPTFTTDYHPGEIIATDDVLFVSTTTSTSIYDIATGAKLQTLDGYADSIALCNGMLIVCAYSEVRAYVASSDYDRPPTADNAHPSVSEDSLSPISLTGSDPDDDPLVAVITALPAQGTLYQTGDGITPGPAITTVPTLVSHPQMTLLYQPQANGFGPAYDTFNFKVNDGRQFSGQATVTVTVIPIPDPPVAVDDTYVLAPGETLEQFRPQANDTDNDQDTLSIVAFTQPAKGTVTQDASGALTYVPPAGFLNGVTTFTYTVQDTEGQTDSATVTLHIDPLAGTSWTTYGNGPGHPGFTPAIFRDGPFNLKWENDLNVSLNQAAVSEGRIYLTPHGSFYKNNWVRTLDERTGAERWLLDLSFEHDGYGVNPPTVDGGRLYVQRGESSNPGGDSRLYCLDITDGAVHWSAPFEMSLDYYMAPCAADGKVWINGGSNGGLYGFSQANGDELFFTQLEDYAGWTPGYHQGALYSLAGDTFRRHDPVTGDILWSLELEEGTVSSLMERTIAFDGGTAFVITNDPNIYGQGELVAINLASQSVAWRAADDLVVNATPAIANGIVYVLTREGAVNAYLSGSGQLSAVYATGSYQALISQPLVTHDRVFAASEDNTYIFDLHSAEKIQTIPRGGQLSVANGTLFIAGNDGVLSAYAPINPANHTPVPVNAQVSIAEEASVPISLEAADSDGDQLSYLIQSLPAVGKLYQTVDGTTPGKPIERPYTYVDHPSHTVIYIAPLDAFGQGVGTFTFAAADDDATSEPGEVIVNLLPVNDPPVALDDVRHLTPGVIASPLQLRINDLDVDGDILEIVRFTQPAAGQIRQNNDGTLRYEPPADAQNATLQFSYTVSDASGSTDTAQVTLVIDATAGNDWSTFGNGPGRTGYAPLRSGTGHWEPAWSVPIDNVSHSLHQVAVAEGKIHVIAAYYTGTPTITCLDAGTGETLWQRTFAQADSFNPPTVHNGVVYFQRGNHRYDSQLWALDAADGSTRWSSPYEAQWEKYQAPCVADDSVWIAGGTFGGIYGYSQADGTRQFFVTLSMVDNWTPSYHQGAVYSYAEGVLTCHNPQTGATQWSVDLEGTSYTDYQTPVFEGNQAFLVNKFDILGPYELASIHLATHEVAWRRGGEYRYTPAIANGIVYAIKGTAVEALRASDGKILSSYETGDTDLRYQPLVTADRLMVASPNATYIFSLDTGGLLQQIEVGGYLSLADDSLYIAGSDNAVHAYTQAAEINFTPGSQSRLTEPLEVTLTAAMAGARIHYTLDGSAPKLSSPSISSGNSITLITDATVRAISVDGSAISPIYEAVYGFSNSDGDALPDWWETAYFGNTGSRDGYGDADHDGRTDLEEWLAGTDPTNANSHLDMISTMSEGNQIVINWASVTNRFYRVEISTNLIQWIPVTDWLPGTGSTMQHIETLDASPPRSLFYRIRVHP